jgi:hypothetical protein
MLGVWQIRGRGASCALRQWYGQEASRPPCDPCMPRLSSGLPCFRLHKGGSAYLALQDPKPGNSRTPYKMVILVDVWVDDGEQHEILRRVAERIIDGELNTLLHESHFKVSDEGVGAVSGDGIGFSTYINSVSFVSRTDLN